MESDSTNPYPQPGDVLSKKFRVDKLIGTGATGAVFQGWHLSLEEKVSIKLLLPELRHHSNIVERFVREARAAVRIKNQHVSRVMDVGKLATGVPYMVMEFLEGRDLEQILEQQGKIPIDQAVSYVLQATEAIAEAHSLGIVHRDLKPGNLFVAVDAGGSEIVKVLDFGISKALVPQNASQPAGERERSLTGTAMVGSPDYMSPEQIVSSRNVDTRADIWSLGVTLYQLVSGKLPFDAEDVADLFNAVVHDPAIPLRKRDAAAPARLEEIVAKCLEKDPNARYQTVAELATALADIEPVQGKRSAAIATNYLRRAEERLSGDFSGAKSVPGVRGGSIPPPRASSPKADAAAPVVTVSSATMDTSVQIDFDDEPKPADPAPPAPAPAPTPAPPPPAPIANHGLAVGSASSNAFATSDIDEKALGRPRRLWMVAVVLVVAAVTVALVLALKG